MGAIGVLLIVACEGGGGRDAAVDSPLVDDAGLAVTAPAPPALPAIPPCPAGWREVTLDGVAACDPWPEGGPETCGPHEAHFPGTPGCARIGTDCPADGLPAGVPPGDVLYVLAAAPAGGDGSRAAPFRRIAEALAAIGPGGTVAVGRGVYDETVRLSTGVTIAGACPAETRLTSSLLDGTVVVVGEATVRNVEIAGGGAWGVVVRDGAALVLQETVVRDTEITGIFVNAGGRLTARRIAVRDIRGLSADGTFGRGIEAESRATADIETAVVERCLDTGIQALGEESIVRLTGVAVRDIRVDVIGQGGRGISIDDGGRIELDASIVEDCHELGIAALGGSSVLVRRSIVRGTRPDALGVRFGRGVHVQDGSRAELDRVLVDDNVQVGVAAIRDGDVLVLHDTIVRRTAGLDGLFGRGIVAEARVEVDLARVLLAGNREVSLAVDGGAVVRATDLVIRDTEAEEATGDLGRALAVQGGAHVVIERALFERSSELAVFASDPATLLELRDAEIREVHGRTRDGQVGQGVHAQTGARIELRRARVVRSREIGVLAGGEGTVVTAEALTVEETLPRRCAEDGRCPDLGGGVALGAYDRGQLTAAFFSVSGSALAGVQVARDGSLDLRDGEVAHNPIGANVQVPGYDLARLRERVSYRDNGRDLDLDALSVPEPGL